VLDVGCSMFSAAASSGLRADTSSLTFSIQSTGLPFSVGKMRAARPVASPVPFGLNAFEQLGVRLIQVVSEFHRCVQGFGIHLETFSQFPVNRIVKEGNVLIQIRHDSSSLNF
jgi:hypothetical protein